MTINFNPGPSQPYPKIESFIADALSDGVAGWSHRSPEFSSMLTYTENNLRLLLEIPTDYHVWFLASATEAMERIIQNTVSTTSYHIEMGAFSAKFATIAEQLGKTVMRSTAEWGSRPDLDQLVVPDVVELIAVTHNETSTGVALDVGTINRLHSRYPKPLLAVDMVSSAPLTGLDLCQTDLAFFSVQKAFGLPSGLGVLIASPRALDTASRLLAAGQVIGSYHSFLSLAKSAAKHQTPETPNGLGIYLLGRVASDMLDIGLTTIRSQIDQQAAAIYTALETHPHLRPLVTNPVFRSSTVIVAEITGNNGQLLDSLSAVGHMVGKGYAHQRNSHIRIANFPAHIGTTPKLINLLEDWRNE